MYFEAKPQLVTIGQQRIWVDSRLEERVLRWLEANGYQDKWLRPNVGLSMGKYNYTPDIELGVFYQGQTHRALVEVKPAKRYFTPAIARRMCGVAPHYFCKVLLLYADKERSWYSINLKTGQLTPTELPPPCDKPIAKLYKPLSLPARSIYAHRYKRRLDPLEIIGKVVSTFFWAIMGDSTPKRRRHY